MREQHFDRGSARHIKGNHDADLLVGYENDRGGDAVEEDLRIHQIVGRAPVGIDGKKSCFIRRAKAFSKNGDDFSGGHRAAEKISRPNDRRGVNFLGFLPAAELGLQRSPEGAAGPVVDNLLNVDRAGNNVLVAQRGVVESEGDLLGVIGIDAGELIGRDGDEVGE